MSDEKIVPSPKQSILDKYVEIITMEVSEKAIKESYINVVNFHLPTLIIDKAYWHDVALIIRDNQQMKFNYLMNLSGIDYEDYMEVIYHLYSYDRDDYLAIKIATEHEGGSVPSVLDIWKAADWQEREAYDLLGIDFSGRKVTRILLSENWVGHPLRKDYVQPEEEV
ncbi:MAG: NADH-quinone oxidoreductase subunit C [Vulcanibacillus sp.]